MKTQSHFCVFCSDRHHVNVALESMSIESPHRFIIVYLNFLWKCIRLVRLGRLSRRIRRFRWPTDRAFSVAENTFFKPGPRKRPICVFVIGFVWTPNMQTMTSLPPPPHQEGNLEARRICFVWFHLYYFYRFEYSPLVNWMTNCTFKSIICSILKV